MKNNYLFVFALLFLTNQCSILSAQSRIPDLRQALHASPNNYDLLYELGKEYESQNIDSCFYYLNIALDIAQRQNNPQAIAQTMYRLGYTYTIFVRNDAKATEWLNRAIDVAKNSKDNLNLARSYHCLGMIAYYQNSNKAEELLNKAIEYAKASNDWKVLVDTYDIMAERYSKQKRYKEVEKVYYNAMLASEKYSPDDWFSSGLDYAEALIAQNRAEEAHVFAQGLVAVVPKLKKSKGDFVYAMDLGRLTTRLKRYTEADSMFQTALTTEKSKPRPDTFRINTILINLLDVYAQMGSGLQVRQTIDELTDIRLARKENRLTQDSKLKMAELKSALELEQKQSQINLLDAQHRQQRILLLSIGLIALLFAVFIILLRRNQKRIEQQKTELVALNATKNKLFAILSHDLMSPVDTLKNYTILVDWGAMTQETFAENLQRFKTTLSNTSNMLQNVLHWAVTQMGGMTLKRENVNVSEVFKEQIALIEPITNDKKIQVQEFITTDEQLNMDKNHLALILRNLLQNALKFTNKDGTIQFSYQNTEGGKRIRIKDNGIGMTPEIRTQLFQIDKNTQRAGTSEEKGTGLGLILTKELVELNGGTIDVASEVGKGTTFTLAF
jgi:signal transduction histidine kinase